MSVTAFVTPVSMSGLSGIAVPRMGGMKVLSFAISLGKRIESAEVP